MMVAVVLAVVAALVASTVGDVSIFMVIWMLHNF